MWCCCLTTLLLQACLLSAAVVFVVVVAAAVVVAAGIVFVVVAASLVFWKTLASFLRVFFLVLSSGSNDILSLVSLVRLLKTMLRWVSPPIDTLFDMSS